LKSFDFDSVAQAGLLAFSLRFATAHSNSNCRHDRMLMEMKQLEILTGPRHEISLLLVEEENGSQFVEEATTANVTKKMSG
jgi:hypothetical protein